MSSEEERVLLKQAKEWDTGVERGRGQTLLSGRPHSFPSDSWKASILVFHCTDGETDTSREEEDHPNYWQS